jgi:hypothetical protein
MDRSTEDVMTNTTAGNQNPFGTFIEAVGGEAIRTLTAHCALSSCTVVLRRDPPHEIAGGTRSDCAVVQLSLTLD